MGTISLLQGFFTLVDENHVNSSVQYSVTEPWNKSRKKLVYFIINRFSHSRERILVTGLSNLDYNITFPICSSTVKLGYNEHARDRVILFVTAVIRYNHEHICTKVAIWDQKSHL